VIASTDVTIAAGDVLVGVNAQKYLAFSTQNTAATIRAFGPGLFKAGESVATMTTPAAALKKAFIATL